MKKAADMYQYCLKNNFGQGMTANWALKHFQLVENPLASDEDVIMCFICLHNFQSISKHDNNYAYAITNKRIIMAQKKIIGENLQSVAINNLNDITLTTSLVFGIITIDTMKERFNVGVNKQVARNINKVIHDVLLNLQATRTTPQTIMQNASQFNTKDKLQQLKELGDLKANGVITDAEFQYMKQDIIKTK